MGVKSIKVPQPEFSHWVIQRRQELGLSPAGLSDKLNGRLSERTLKYLEDGRRESFSEYTLTILSEGLELNYPDLLHQVEELHSNGERIGGMLMTTRAKRMVPFLLTAVFAVILTVALFKELVLNQSNELVADTSHLYDVRIHADYPQIIFATDSKGNILWQKNLKTKVRKIDIYDLDRNGSKEVIAATYKNGLGDRGECPGSLFVWNERGEQITTYDLWKPSIYPAEEPELNIGDFQITDLEKDGKPDIVAITAGVEYYPSRLAVLHFQNSTFTEIKTYWHPGYLTKLLIEDINADGFPEIICAAANNDLKRLPAFRIEENVRAVFMLQGRSVLGQAPPYLGKAGKGSQVWYRYLTPPVGYEASDIVAMSVVGGREKNILIKLKEGCYFYLNYAGEIVDRFYGDHCTGKSEMHLIADEKMW